MELIYYLFVMGIVVEAMSGTLAAGEKQMDFFGVIVIATVTALGGGTIRDVLIGNYPLLWVDKPIYLLYTTIAAAITIIAANHIRKIYKLFLYLDALGLAAFSIVATEKGINLGLKPSIIVIIAMITGIAGGMMRDILCNNVPLIFRKELYAIVAMFGSIFYQVMFYFDVDIIGIEIITLICTFGIRAAAIKWHIMLPQFNFSHED